MQGSFEHTVIAGACVRALMSVVFIGVPGFCAGRFDFFSSDFLSTLSRFQLMFLEPSLVFASVASRLDADSISLLFPIIRASCFALAVGCGTAWVVIRFFPCAKDWTAFARIMFYMISTFQNGGSFPLAVMQSLCNDLFHSDGHCFQDASLVVFSYSVPWHLAMWGIGYNLVAEVIKQPRSEVEMMESQPSGWIPKNVSRTISIGVESASSLKSVIQQTQTSGFHPKRIAQAIIGIMNPILVALLAGIVVGCIPPLQYALFHHGGMLFVFGSSMKTVGNVVPVVGITILSASLGINLLNHSKNTSQKNMRSPDSLGMWVGLGVTSKLLFVPLVGALFIFLTQGSSVQAWFWPSSLNARLVVVLNWVAPPCLCMVVLCHRFGVGESAMRYFLPLYLICYTAVILTSIPFIVGTFASMPTVINDVIEDQAVQSNLNAKGISAIDVAETAKGNMTHVANAAKQVAATAAPAVAAAITSAINGTQTEPVQDVRKLADEVQVQEILDKTEDLLKRTSDIQEEIAEIEVENEKATIIEDTPSIAEKSKSTQDEEKLMTPMPKHAQAIMDEEEIPPPATDKKERIA